MRSRAYDCCLMCMTHSFTQQSEKDSIIISKFSQHRRMPMTVLRTCIWREDQPKKTEVVHFFLPGFGLLQAKKQSLFFTNCQANFPVLPFVSQITKIVNFILNHRALHKHIFPNSTGDHRLFPYKPIEKLSFKAVKEILNQNNWRLRLNGMEHIQNYL